MSAIALPKQETDTHASPAPCGFDGVICFGGEDWWYHNRGHYDMQMMRELSRRVPVLYVNSIGMRMPRVGEGAMFVKRVVRKLRSLSRGVVPMRERFAVYSPFVAPGPLGMAVTARLLPRQVRRAAARVGVTRPLVWVACPPAAEAIDALDPVGVVYQRTDRYERFKDVDSGQIAGYDRMLKDRADLTLFCASLLMEEEGDDCRRALYIDHGVDYDRFAGAGAAPVDPPDVAHLPKPRVGFIGGIDAHTFDPALFVDVASRLPEVPFVLVGACSLPENWCPLRNVHLLGRKPYDEVASYMAACDVLIMPWNNSEWIRACNPVKLKEYLAVGRPIVTTPFHELRRYEGLIRIARTGEQFAGEIRAALAERGDVEQGRERVRSETWRAKGEAVFEALEGLGLAPITDTTEARHAKRQ